jgi:hypothetical protein
MARGTRTGPSQQTEKDIQAAGGGQIAVGHPTYAEAALKLFDNGYAPIPIRPGEKRPAVKGWSDVRMDHAQVEAWAREHTTHGIGLLTGNLVGIDVDILDPDIAHQMGQIVERGLGSTLMRVGLWPKRLYLARTDTPFAKLQIGKLEILGRGQQLVAFGIHPDTQQPYYWPQGDSPLDIPLSDLPLVNEADCKALLSELAGLQPEIGAAQLRRRSTSGVAVTSSGPVRHANGLVADGRDGWLSSLAYHVVHDARDLGAPLDPDTLANRVWQRFSATTDLSRPKRDGAEFYAITDSLRKVRDKLGLLAASRLPPRLLPDVEPVAVDPGLPVEEARTKLAAAIGEFCARAEAWHVSGHIDAAPRVGLRASVGLGKTAVSREHLLQSQAQLRAKGLPHRILVFTPSLALADESARGWMQEGLRVAVHRGYEAKTPGGDTEMCRDLDMVRMAIASGQSVFHNACMRRGGARCHNFEACAKQDNLAEVHKADVVLAAYDSLFSGLPIKADDVALMVVDEGCWERAIKRTQLALDEITAMDACSEPRMNDTVEEELAWSELFSLRQLVQQALRTYGPGVVPRQALRTAGLSVDACERAAVLEVQLRVEPGLRPGLPQGARRRAVELSLDANRSVRREALFLALAQLLNGPAEQDGRIRVLPPDPITCAQHVLITGLHQVHDDLQRLPVLHLDATLRPEMAATVLPEMTVTDITAAASHMTLTAVQGRFAKSTLVADAKADVTENRRRANRLKECVDYVRWHAARVTPGRTLVVTYKAIECAFAGIPGVVTGHFKAIAGLDSFKDVALLIVIGRPMPSDVDIAHLTGAYLGHVPSAGYRMARRGVPMRNGSRRAFVVRQHEDPRAEEVRAAVCDDEVIQAIGRARGVNRTADNPVAVHLLADVALPLVHDQVISWALVCPDIFQQMLREGMAVDSPADAARIHPEKFGNAEQAKKAFQRGVFGGHFPIENTYREMSLKSARYRRAGRGRSWQRVWWIDGDEHDVRQNLEAVLGKLDGWLLPY